ncbi:MAG TPA: pseudouridine synthase [Fodinibius sp.]|nr:pseudouridine synthase [Fodinibius sp.]
MSRRRKKRSNKRRRQEAPHAIDQDYEAEEPIRLNKYIAHCGFCSRRKADDFIAAGKVEVNDELVTQMGVKVQRTDKVTVEGQHLSLEKFVYILLNKPKDTITTTDDPRNRDTVMDKIEDATGKRVYPVGRLDRHTMGLLLLTNDGDLANRLMHPSYEVRKTYEVETERKLRDDELKELAKGIELEDGPVQAQHVDRLNNENGFVLSIYEGRNRLVRRMVEYFGTQATKLKRVDYAGLNLDNVRMGRWRYLRKNEINALRKLVKLDPLDFNKGGS